VTIRDQRPLQRGHVDLVGGWTWERYLVSLGERVFFWPGDPRGPISPGRRLIGSYSLNDQLTIRVNFLDLVKLNAGSTVYFCKYNSGAPRTFAGQRSPRGPHTFLKADEWTHHFSKVVEVSFIGSLSLPATAELLDADEWRTL
jgi:hypothetical protein